MADRYPSGLLVMILVIALPVRKLECTVPAIIHRNIKRNKIADRYSVGLTASMY